MQETQYFTEKELEDFDKAFAAQVKEIIFYFLLYSQSQIDFENLPGYDQFNKIAVCKK